MDANHEKRLKELTEKGKLDKNEKVELAGLKKHQAETAKGASAPVAEPVADEPKAEGVESDAPDPEAKPKAKK